MKVFDITIAEDDGPGSMITSVDCKNQIEAEKEAEVMLEETFKYPWQWKIESVEKQED